jgi:hypothetical protein
LPFPAIVAQAQYVKLFVAEAGHLPIDEDEEEKAYYPANYDAPNVMIVKRATLHCVPARHPRQGLRNRLDRKFA